MDTDTDDECEELRMKSPIQTFSKFKSLPITPRGKLPFFRNPSPVKLSFGRFFSFNHKKEQINHHNHSSNKLLVNGYSNNYEKNSNLSENDEIFLRGPIVEHPPDDDCDDSDENEDDESDIEVQDMENLKERQSSVSSRVFKDPEFLFSLINYSVTLNEEEFLSEDDEIVTNDRIQDVTDDVDCDYDTNDRHSLCSVSTKDDETLNLKDTESHSTKIPTKANDTCSSILPSQLTSLTLSTQPKTFQRKTSKTDPRITEKVNSISCNRFPIPSYGKKQPLFKRSETAPELIEYPIEHHDEDDQDDLPLNDSFTTTKECSKLNGNASLPIDEEIDQYFPSLFKVDLTTNETNNTAIKCKRSKESVRRRLSSNFANVSSSDDNIRPTDESLTENKRRSNRNRVHTLNFWEGQRPLYKSNKDDKGVPLSTLVGVSDVKREPQHKRNIGKRSPRVRRNSFANGDLKMENILNLSIHNKKLLQQQKLRKRLHPDDEEENQEFILSYSKMDFKNSKNSPGISTAIINKISNIAFGKLKFETKSVKKKTKTGDYVTHFNVVYGTLLLTIDGKADSIVKTGFYFHVDKQTTYSITNLRDDEAMIDFTIIKDIP